MTKIVYIRDDDVFRLDKTFLKVFRLFKKYKIPLIYAVIPKSTTKELVAFLNKEKKKNPKAKVVTEKTFAVIFFDKRSHRSYRLSFSKVSDQK